ncbi:hypothetical protein B6U58_09815, partial [Ligilactobacillus salivarius]
LIILNQSLYLTCTLFILGPNNDGYSRTLEEAMLSKYFSIDVTTSLTKREWIEKKENSKLKFVIPTKGIEEENSIKLRDILKSTSSSKTNFMYSVVLNEKVEKTEPNYIQGGLEWLMK